MSQWLSLSSKQPGLVGIVRKKNGHPGHVPGFLNCMRERIRTMSEASAKKYKSHRFHCGLKWTGEKSWDVLGESKPVVKGGPPAAFGGSGEEWSPEELFLASINTCHLSSFVAYSTRKGFEYVSYESGIEGLLEHDGTGFRYTKVVIRPKLVVKSEEDIETGVQYIKRAHTICFISNSVNAEVIVEPEITVG